MEKSVCVVVNQFYNSRFIVIVINACCYTAINPNSSSFYYERFGVEATSPNGETKQRREVIKCKKELNTFSIYVNRL